MAITRVTFGEWLPDQPGVIGALTTARNCYPKAVGYGPFPQEVDYSDDAPQALTAAAAAKDTNSITSIYAAGTTRLFKLDTSDFSWDDISATTYSGTSGWKFTQFGNSLIAANESNTMQFIDVMSGTTFANIAVDAPKAKFVTVVRDFVVSGYQTANKSRIQWSGINNEKTWTTSATTQADFQDVPDGGFVQGVTGGEFGLVLLERSIVRMSYVGTPLIFQFDNIARNRGCFEPNSVIQWQGITYFLGDDGFYACDGQNLKNIGAEKVNRYFFNSLKESDLGSMSAAIDPINNLVVWGYPSVDTDYRVLIYHIATGKWSYSDSSATRVAPVSTPSITLEGLDAFSASIDALGVSLDSRNWLGGKLLLLGLKGSKLITFTGAAKTATIETSDIESPANQSMVTMIKPIVDNGTGSASVASRLQLNQTVSFPSVTAANSENRIGTRSYGRYHRVKLEPSGNWTTAIGMDVDIQSAGTR
ncbi:MAG: hypothetical protein ACOYNN_14585 [Terrimicrobiaceae bacterium]